MRSPVSDKTIYKNQIYLLLEVYGCVWRGYCIREKNSYLLKMPTCPVKYCHFNLKKKCAGIGNDKNITFHRIPKDSNRRKQWIINLSLDEKCVTDNTLICSQHFCTEMFDRTSVSCVRLRPNAVPKYNAEISKATEAPVDGKDLCNRSTSITPFTPIQIVNSPIKTQFRRVIEQQRTKYCKKIKVLQQSCRRKDKRIAHLQDIIKELRNKRFIDEEQILNSLVGDTARSMGNQVSVKRR
ncbi:THAP domain-containing protein 2-like isoform X1 [Hylaeus anthracinus]|uniref:THAP domain-containing protein 2-like isoform X1 n=1 Tax=Hylaeus anthracinus TaxID=313031 RepID=UPI0023BA1132|nr:THAP domain-containing protein 2-like isoform X1 [Hylaeus anthracinus]